MAKTEEQMAAEQADRQQAEKQAKLKALQAAMSKIEKDFGKGSIMRGAIQILDDATIEAMKAKPPQEALPKQKELFFSLNIFLKSF